MISVDPPYGFFGRPAGTCWVGAGTAPPSFFWISAYSALSFYSMPFKLAFSPVRLSTFARRSAASL